MHAFIHSNKYAVAVVYKCCNAAGEHPPGEARLHMVREGVLRYVDIETKTWNAESVHYMIIVHNVM